MAAKTTNQTILNSAASIITEEDLEDMEHIQRDLEDKIMKAHEDGRAFMMAQYVRLLATVKSEVKRIRNRFDRDSLAAHRLAHRALKAASKAPSTAQQEPRNDA